MAPGTASSGELPPVDIFERGLDASIMAAGRVFGAMPRDYYQINHSNREEDVTFPARLSFMDNKAIINVHEEAFYDYCERLFLAADDIGPLDIAKIHIGATVIPHILLSSINPRDSLAINSLYDHMANSDVIDESIADRLLELCASETIARLTVANRSEDEICLINRFRLAAGALAYTESDAGIEVDGERQSVDFGGRLEKAFMAELALLQSEIESYVKTARALGIGSHVAEQQFFDSVSAFEIAYAFPMRPEELSVIGKYC